MNPPPPNWPRASSSVFYNDAAAAIDFLERAFGFETRVRIEGPDGHIQHSELTYGDAVVMVGSTGARPGSPVTTVSPVDVGGRNTQSLFLYVDDVDAHVAQARAAGAVITSEPKNNDYGDEWWEDRSYEAVDPEGHRWWFAHRVRNPRT